MRQNYYPSKKRAVVGRRGLFSIFCTALWLLVFSGTNVQAQHCDSNSPYDQIQSSFHSTVVTRVDGMFLCWGERSAPNGTANNLSPLEVTPANGYIYTGSPRDISLSSNSSNNAQFFLLTTAGLYAWGTADIAIPTTLKNTTAFGTILMPVGVTSADIKKMLATRDALLLLTNAGEVWIAARNANMFGMGGTVPGAPENYWGKVTVSTGANPALTGVEDVRISPAGAFAYTSAGEYYTWGPNVFLGDGTPAGARNRATLMQAPFAGTPKMIAMTAGVTGGARQASFYAIDPTDGRIYATGNNTNGQLGRGNNTSQTGWVNVRLPGNTADVTNATFISGNDQDGWSTSTGAVSFITSDHRLWGLGSNQGTMIGGPVNNADYNLPITPAGFNFGVDNPFYVEVGGHTSVYVKECSDRYCYVGHRISGSMGDGTNTSQFEPTFNCTYTAASVICGASTFDASDAPVSYDNGFATNHYYMCMDSLYLGNIPPKANNGLVPVNVAPGADNNLAVGGDMLLGLEEDGIAAFPVYTGTNTYTLSVRALNIMGSTANLYAWVDWNDNGRFDANEFATQTYASMAGRQDKNVTWTVDPSVVTCGRKYVRVRLTMDVLTDNPATTNVDERSVGTANNGEIEDFNIIANVATLAGADIYADFQNQLPGGSVTMAGTGVGVWAPSVTNPGTATITAPTSVSTTITNFTAPGAYTFIWRSGTGSLSCSDSMTVHFNVKPVANNDIASTNEDAPVVINVALNDTDIENLLDSSSVTIINAPANGTVNVNPVTGEVTYTPAPGYDGPDSFTYRICDNPPTPFVSLCDTATVLITVNPVNHPPVANNDNATTPEETPVTVNVSGNDTDPDGNLVPSSVSVIPGGGPSNGTFTLNGTGGIVYTPNTNYSGNDTIIYSICDNGVPAPAYCDTATLYITITPVNDPPVIGMPPATTPEDTPVTVCSPITDPDAGNTFVASICGGPANGTITGPTVMGGQVCVTYTPNADYDGLDSVCVVVCDQGGLCDTSTTVITVTPVNDPPVADNDSNTTNEDIPVNGDVSTNDNATDGPGETYALVNGPVNGTLTFNNDGTYTYTPNLNYNGPDVFTYSICDGGTPNLCDTAIVNITIAPVNDAPVVNADNATTDEDTPVVINVVPNDTDVDGVIVPNSVAMVTQPANGTTTINAATGEITYTPNPDFNGTDTFIYLACDNGTPLPSLCDTAVVTVTVLPVNDPPVADNDNNTTNEDTPVNGDVSNNDDSTDGPGETYTLVNGPANGTLTFNNDGTYTYTPNANYNGPDVFTYSICDGAVPNLCDTTTVTINVVPVNDPPVINLPPATTPEDTPVTVCSPITDPDAGNTFTATRCGGPNNGTISGPTVFNGQVCVTYTPNPNYNGLDSVCIIVCDQNGLCDTSTTVITVTPVNDPPVANNDNNTTNEDTPVNGDVSTNDNPTDGPGETYTLVNGPANGTLTFNNDGTYTYTPNTNYNGPDVFTYSICDGGTPNLCDTATVNITVVPVNDPPVINLPPATTPEDTPVTVCSPIVDFDSNVFSAGICGGPSNGTITGPTILNGQVCVTYTPNPNYNGLDSVCVIVCDQGGLCDTSTTVITVTPVNDPPVANNDNNTTNEDTPVNGDVSTNDNPTDGPGETYTLVNGPANGTLTFNNDGTYTYTPNANYNGPEVFTYSICDGGTPNLCDTAVVNITVVPVNDPPVINLPPATTPEDTPVTVCSPITDPDAGNTFTATVCGGPNNGSISGPSVFNGQVCLTYTPNANYNGLDSVCVIVCDQGGLCDTSTTVITVTPVNDPPVANNNTATTPEDTPVVINVPGNDTDVDGNLDSASVTVSTPPSHGTVTIDPVTGEVTYTPNPNYNGPDVFTYSICDTGSPVYCDTAVVSINVTPVNDPPVINLPPSTTPEDTPVTVCSPITDADFGDVFAASLCGGPYNGTVSGPTVFNGQVCVTYTPSLNYNGLDSICVIVCDQNGLCDTSTTVITVTPVNDPPTAVDDVDSTTTNTPVTVSILTNDTDPDDGLDSTTVTIVTPPTQGTVTVNPNGTATYTPNANACGTDTFVYQVCDNGNPAPSLCDQASVTITIVDAQAPALTCPAGLSVSNTAGRCGHIMTGTALDPTVTDNCSAVTLTHDYYAWGNPNSLQGATFPVGTTTVQWAATDAAGNMSTCSVNITVTDAEAPSFLNCQDGAVYTVGLFSGDCEGSTIWATPVAVDNCSAVSVTQTAGPAPGSILTVGTYVITYTATDGAGNRDSCSFTLNVVDTEMPTIACPGNVFQATTDAGVCGWTSPAASLTPLMVQSNCASTIAWQVTNPDASNSTGTGDVSGYTFALGTSTVTYTITEMASGQILSCSFTVTVTDDEAPVFTGCPSDMTVANTAGNCNATVTWTAPTATDNCNVTVTSTHNSGDVFPVGTTTVTYTATDAAGNVSTCSFDVTVTDTELPVFTACPASINASNDAGVCGATVTWAAPVATDNCGVSVTSTHNSGEVFPIGTTTVTYTATDAAGNETTCSFDVTVTDDEAPVVTNCPSDITVSNLYNTCYQQVYWPAITATDNCGSTGIAITSTHQPGYVFPLGTTVVTYVVTDATGNVDSCSFNVIVQDTQSPTIQGCPINMTVQNDAGACGAVVTWVEPSVFDNCSGVSVSSTQTSGSVFPVGTTTVTYTVVDGAGNADSCSFTVTVVDKELPVIAGCPANISVGSDPGICGANVTWAVPVITDNCPGVTFTSTHNSGDLFPIGTTTVTYTATDVAGNASICSFTVTVADMQAPTVSGCPSNITVGNDAGICGASVTWTAPVFTDNCGAPTVTGTHNSGAVFPVGTTTVTYTATDAAGNNTICSFNVTVNETEAPVISNCPGNITVNNNFNVCGATVIWAAPTVTDNCGTPAVTATHTPGTVFPIGTTTVTYVAVDASGNSDTCSFTVTVNDTQAPQITGCPENISLPALAGSCQNQAFWTAPSALDNCPGVTMTGSHTSGGNFPVGVTTVTYTATDASGNVTVCSFTVTITDNVSPVTANCPANINATTDAGICGAAITWTAPVFTDNCGTPTVTSTHNSGDIFPVGTTTVTYTATDVAGNSTTCSFGVTVADDEAPVIAGCPSDMSVSTDAGICGATVTWTAPTATDNCAIVGFTGSHAPGTVFPVGTTTVTYTATDAAGNNTSCSFNITVTDNVTPTVSNCPGDMTLNAAFNTCGAPVMWAAPTFTDNCSGLTVTTTHLPGTTFPVGTTTVTYTATDVSGNAVSCSFDITVNDVQVPVISACPIDMTVTNNAGVCGAAVNWVLPTAFDNCSGTTFTSTHAPGSVFAVGTTTVTYTATDASGNTATCSFNVTVLDKEAPAINNCPAGITVSNDAGICGASVTWTAPTATDNCGIQTFTSSHNIGDVFPVGTTTVIYTATDTAGNESECSFTVTVNDTELPVVTGCPADISGCVSSPITWTAPTATDNCGNVTVTSTHNPGDIFPIGVTTVTYTVTDDAGNVSTCTFDVSIYEPRLTVVKTDVSCNGMNDGTATVTVNGSVGPYTFNWGAQGTDSLITNLAPGVYSVTVTDIFGCSASDTLTITEPEVFKVTLGTVQHATCGFTDGSAEVKTEGGTLAYGYQWSDGQTTQSLYNVADGMYKLTATDANGCSDSLTVTITCEFGKVPQLLSPNGDGHNDTWVIPGIDKYPDAVVEVYNRWGNLVYQATPYLNDWAGISKGMLTVGKDRLPAGTYFYVITLTKGAKGMTGYIELQY